MNDGGMPNRHIIPDLGKILSVIDVNDRAVLNVCPSPNNDRVRVGTKNWRPALVGRHR